MLGFNEIGDEGLINTLGWFHKHYNGVMTRLDISFNNLSDASAIALGDSDILIDHLEHLHLAGNKIGDGGFRHFARGWSRGSCKLSYLDISGNNATEEGAASIGHLLQAPNCCLETLVIKGNALGPKGTNAISSSLVANTTLTSLNISNNNIGDAGMSHLSDALTMNNLKELDISFNGVTSAGVLAVRESLKKCTNLDSLILDNNKIGNEGATALVDCLVSLQVTKLGVAFNKIDTAGMRNLLLLLPENLTSLDVSGNRITSSVVEELFDLLVNSSTLKELNIDHHKIGEAGCTAIVSGIASNRYSALCKFVGFALGPAMTKLDSPMDMKHLSNDKVLAYLAELWKASSTGACPPSPSAYVEQAGPSSDSEEDEGVLDAASLTSREDTLDGAGSFSGALAPIPQHGETSAVTAAVEMPAWASTSTSTSTSTTAAKSAVVLEDKRGACTNGLPICSSAEGRARAQMLLAAAVATGSCDVDDADDADDADDISAVSRATSVDSFKDDEELDQQYQPAPRRGGKGGMSGLVLPADKADAGAGVGTGTGTGTGTDYDKADAAVADAGLKDSLEYLHTVAVRSALTDAAALSWRRMSSSSNAAVISAATAVATSRYGRIAPTPEMYARFKQISPQVLPTLRELSTKPFNPAELWELNQEYFGVKTVAANARGEIINCSSDGNSDEEVCLPHEPVLTGRKSAGRAPRGTTHPAKMRRYPTRIEAYPEVMALVSELHESNDDAQILSVLRQLRYLEESRKEGLLDEDLGLGALLLFLL